MPGFEQASRIVGKDGSLADVTTQGAVSVDLAGMSGTCRSTRVTVSSGQVKLPSIPLDKRKVIGIYVPAGGATVYVGGSGVTVDQGFPVLAGEKLFIDGRFDVYAIASSSVDIRIIEGS